jgi:hypothetical protein|tara:strand:+ start:709 stop:939 length:231 start_codon:yes stop_codon:yes gene_type:complete
MDNLNNKIKQVLDGSLQEQKDLHEISIGKLSTTVLLTRLMGQLKKIEDKDLQQVLRTLSYMVYTTSLQHKPNNKRR